MELPDALTKLKGGWDIYLLGEGETHLVSKSCFSFDILLILDELASTCSAYSFYLLLSEVSCSRRVGLQLTLSSESRFTNLLPATLLQRRTKVVK